MDKKILEEGCLSPTPQLHVVEPGGVLILILFPKFVKRKSSAKSKLNLSAYFPMVTLKE